MPKFPEPPSRADLAKLPPELRVVPAGTQLWRVYFRGGARPIAWSELRSYGPTRARFDHHPPPPRVHADRSILYAGASALTCLAEVFQIPRSIDRRADEPWLVGFELTRDVKLLDLSGLWPTKAGASMKINSGDRPRAQRWSRQIHGAYPKVEGIYYPSSMHANQPAVALYERAVTSIPVSPLFHRALADPLLLLALKNAAADLGYGLI